ncbi:uncharacterized protein MONBRDRAFT_32643 [Monosiga brevicollis MX1]|uniref:Arf-GAP domain-containing protein n=1 Tax=Monosiga brevicollis TaxID=81824 RepID=A9V0V6_MONBE|nr:uncharacterized protein MONBRDRAFT_32643 [Monosiga brevicollis MX1]EDQ88701.1 predicted protein [Monosiga brevicollis MX1]|eukprot:XP_001746314.1 hypothetical protein [Monosiga brevicollis MX1]
MTGRQELQQALLDVDGNAYCADCGISGWFYPLDRTRNLVSRQSAEPRWASLKLGVLLCHGCASAHRSLDRRLSVHVVNIFDQHLPIASLKMLCCLGNAVANGYWEACENPKAGPKPHPDDPVMQKHAYIRQKYLNEAFITKRTMQDQTQLQEYFIYVVLSDDLAATYRLLVTGVSANVTVDHYTPLYLAAASGQREMVELLLIYDAANEPTGLDRDRPSEAAHNHGFHECACRIEQASNFVQHQLFAYLLRQALDDPVASPLSVQDREAVARGARQLPQLRDEELSALAVDVCDEIHRRSLEVAWAYYVQVEPALVPKDDIPVMFLPVGPDFGPVRLQTRQKLAKVAQLLQPQFDALTTRCQQLEDFVVQQQAQISQLLNENMELAQALQLLLPVAAEQSFRSGVCVCVCERWINGWHLFFQLSVMMSAKWQRWMLLSLVVALAATLVAGDDRYRRDDDDFFDDDDDFYCHDNNARYCKSNCCINKRCGSESECRRVGIIVGSVFAAIFAIGFCICFGCCAPASPPSYNQHYPPLQHNAAGPATNSNEVPMQSYPPQQQQTYTPQQQQTYPPPAQQTYPPPAQQASTYSPESIPTAYPPQQSYPPQQPASPYPSQPYGAAYPTSSAAAYPPNPSTASAVAPPPAYTDVVQPKGDTQA